MNIVNRVKNSGLTLLAFILFPFSASAGSIPAIVSVEWLAQNITNSKLVIVDIRSDEAFNKGHIPGAVPVPFPCWVQQDENLILELPDGKALQDILGTLGINEESVVIVVNKTDTDWNRADATRVAWTCIVSGVKHVSVLDGGYNRWLKLNQPITAAMISPGAIPYHGILNRSTVIRMPEVRDRIGKAVIIDARLPEDYFGITQERGHIQSAINLPAPWAFNSDGTFRDKEDLKAMAAGLVGKDTQKEIIVYCEVGGFASTWWFILSEVLGYPNVKLYDGSFQEWSTHPDAPVTKFRWN